MTDRRGIDLIRTGISGVAYGDLDSSVFDSGKWDLLDWGSLLEQYPNILQESVKSRMRGVDPREIFFALSKKNVVGTGPVAEAWKILLDTPAWLRAQAEASESRSKKAAALMSMLKSADGDEDIPDGGDGPESSTDGDEQEGGCAGVPSEGDAESAEAMCKLHGVLSGNVDAPNPQQLLDEVVGLAGRIDMPAFSNLLGFSSRIVRGVSRTTKDGTDEMTGYSQSGWSDKVVPQDMLDVANGELGALIRLSESTLTVRKFKGERDLGKGPVVMLRDETWSMGHRASFVHKAAAHRKALSFEIALAQTFNEDGRDLVTIAWGSGNLREHVWGDPAYDLKRHLTSFLGATETKIHTGLVRALKVVDEYVDGADVLIVTDGEIGDADTVMGDSRLRADIAEFRQGGGRVWIVIISDRNRSERLWKRALPFADAIVTIRSLEQGNADLETIIGGMASRYKGSGKRQVH